MATIYNKNNDKKDTVYIYSLPMLSPPPLVMYKYHHFGQQLVFVFSQT